MGAQPVEDSHSDDEGGAGGGGGTGGGGLRSNGVCEHIACSQRPFCGVAELERLRDLYGK